MCATDLSLDRVESVAEEIRALGREASVDGFDVSDREAWPGFVQRVVARHGGAHVLVNNAGVALTGPFLECSVDDLEWQLDVNLRG